MTIQFYKYQGTGNDFVIIDNRHQQFDKNNAKLIGELCDRRFGIGADGLILLEDHPSLDFSMVYFNSDGHPSSMCGNGGRCIVAFAKYLKLIDNEAVFLAIDGTHRARINSAGEVELQMKDVTTINQYESHLFMDTGSPHHIEFVKTLGNINIKENGARIRNSDLYGQEGSNVNFVQDEVEGFRVRTYERGVENETLSCGTGVTAVALAAHYSGRTNQDRIRIKTEGGNLEVRFKVNNKNYFDIWLIGPAIKVFNGQIEI
jgi:diaminopimelate epimerase